MALPAGSHRFGPHNGSLVVRTFREGVAAKVGHDLVIEVTRWEGTVTAGDEPQLKLTADPRSLEVREGLRGVKPLTDRDRRSIAETIDAKILRGLPIEFRSTAVEQHDDRLAVRGELTIAGRTRPVAVEVTTSGERLQAQVTVTQSQWGITPYRGFLGALKVRDDVEIALEAAS